MASCRFISRIVILACLIVTACVAFYMLSPNTVEVDPTPSNVSLMDSVELPSTARLNMVEVNQTPTNMNVSLEPSSSGDRPKSLITEGHFVPFGPPSKQSKTPVNWVSGKSSTARGKNHSKVDESRKYDKTGKKSLPRPLRPRSPNAPPYPGTPRLTIPEKPRHHPLTPRKNPSPYEDSGNYPPPSPYSSENPPPSPHSKENPSPYEDSGNYPPPSPYSSENPPPSDNSPEISPPSDDSPENPKPISEYSDEKPPPSNSAIEDEVQATTNIKANMPSWNILGEGWIQWSLHTKQVFRIAGIMTVVAFVVNLCSCVGLLGWLHQRLWGKQNEQNPGNRGRRRRKRNRRSGQNVN